MSVHFSLPRISQISVPPGWGSTGKLVVIPAPNEAERITACLTPLHEQGADVLVVANNCTDATAAIAADCGAAVVDCTVASGGVGAARRLGVAEGLRRAKRVRAILTSDADCIVATDWVEINMRHIDGGAAAVCGFVQPIAEEHAALPAPLLRRAALEDRFLDLKVQLEQHLTGRVGHEQTPGASLAFAPPAYAAAQGFDPMPTCEDRAIILRLKALGLRVVHAREATVYASCRLEGRAPGGMAAALRERAADPDAPLCPDMGCSDNPVMAIMLAKLGPLRTQADLPLAIRQMEEWVRQ